MAKGIILSMIFSGMGISVIASFFNIQFLLWIGILLMLIGSMFIDNIASSSRNNTSVTVPTKEKVIDAQVIEYKDGKNKKSIPKI